MPYEIYYKKSEILTQVTLGLAFVGLMCWGILSSIGLELVSDAATVFDDVSVRVRAGRRGIAALIMVPLLLLFATLFSRFVFHFVILRKPVLSFDGEGLRGPWCCKAGAIPWNAIRLIEYRKREPGPALSFLKTLYGKSVCYWALQITFCDDADLSRNFLGANRIREIRLDRTDTPELDTIKKLREYKRVRVIPAGNGELPWQAGRG